MGTLWKRGTVGRRVKKTRPVRFTVDQYMQLSEDGHFGDKRTELLDGIIYEMAGQNNPHAIAVTKTYNALHAAFGKGYWVRNQTTVRLTKYDAPEPDLAVVEGDADDWLHRDLPTGGLLFVEIAEASLGLDRNKKARKYAAAGVPEYWIVNVKNSTLEVRRQPISDTQSDSGWRYASVTILNAAQHVTPVARPEATIAVADLLPRLPA